MEFVQLFCHEGNLLMIYQQLFCHEGNLLMIYQQFVFLTKEAQFYTHKFADLDFPS